MAGVRNPGPSGEFAINPVKVRSLPRGVNRWVLCGGFAERALVRVDTNPTEEGRNLAAEQPKRVADLENKLTDYLASVDAETPKPKAPKKKAKR